MTRSLLVADDSTTIRRVVEITFRDSEFILDCVGDGDQALRELRSGRHDLVLADVVMPGPNGYEICRRIKSSARPVPVLLLAGTFESFDHDQARECGADGCLLKPFDSQTLLDRVSMLLVKRDAVLASELEPRGSDHKAPGTDREEYPVTGPEDRAGVAGSEIWSELEIERVVQEVTARVCETVAARLASEIVPRVTETVVREHVRRRQLRTIPDIGSVDGA